MPPIVIDPLYASTTRVRGFRRNIETTSATAFAWAQDTRTYVVTNKHVILGRDFIGNPQPLTSIRLRCHNNANFNANSDVNIDLFSSTMPVWLEHTNIQIDVVLIPTSSTTFHGLSFPAFSSANFPPANLIIGPGEPLVVIGYPLDFYDQANNLPIVRSAALASAYPVPFMGLPMFITDANLHEGTSGAPVLFIARGAYRTTDSLMTLGNLPPVLLGINSATWPVQPQPLHLNATWLSSVITEILSNPRTPTVAEPQP